MLFDGCKQFHWIVLDLCVKVLLRFDLVLNSGSALLPQISISCGLYSRSLNSK